MRFGIGFSLVETIYVDSHYTVDFKNGPNQVHLRKACLVRKNSKMADDLDGIRHLVHDLKSNQGKCIGRPFGTPGSG